MTGQRWPHFQFGLLVTGEGEEKGVSGMFRSLAATKLCSFRVLRRIEQLRPVTSQRRKVRMVRTGDVIPTKDMERIGFPARKHLGKGDDRFLILIDDLEDADDCDLKEVFGRYRSVLDAALRDEQRPRAAVHFLATMMEAYFFADTKTTNEELELDLADHNGDVEEIRNPKAELKKHYPAYKEVEHGATILGKVDIPHVLSDPERCAYLRALFAWCVKHVSAHQGWEYAEAKPNYQLENGVQAEVTSQQ